MAQAATSATSGSTGMPRYPSWVAVLGTSGPVVATLLSAVSTAGFIKALDKDPVTKPMQILSSLTFDSSHSAIVMGALATIVFVAAAIAFMFAQALDFESLPTKIQHRIFTQNDRTTDKAKELEINLYQLGAARQMTLANLFLMVGVIALLLTLLC
jgi:hypothetical protein